MHGLWTTDDTLKVPGTSAYNCIRRPPKSELYHAPAGYLLILFKPGKTMYNDEVDTENVKLINNKVLYHPAHSYAIIEHNVIAQSVQKINNLVRHVENVVNSLG